MSKTIRTLQHFLLLLLLLFVAAIGASAQNTSFNYQGRLTDGGTAANGNYDLQFALWDSASAGTQIGSTLTRSSVAVSAGIFTVQLDFGVSAFPGADRFLEIGVRPAGGGSFTTLSPRQQISSTPYAIHTISAATADALSSACSACIQDAQINQVAGSKVNGTIPVASVPAGSGNYIQNTTSPQATSNFNISGNGIIGGNVGIGTPSPTAKLTVRGAGVFNAPGAARFDLFNTTANTGFLQHVTDGGLWQLASTSGATRMVVDPSGNVGIGTATPSSKLEIAAQDGLAITGFQPFLTLRDSNASNQRSVIQGANGHIVFYPNSFIGGNPPMVILSGSGNVGIGTSTPPHHLSISGGPTWTASGWTGAISMSNASAIGWFGNAALNRFGIGQTNGGLYFFHSGSDPGTTNTAANYDMIITDSGNITQARDKAGLVKAMIYLNESGTILRCYNSTLGGTAATTAPCGFSVSHNNLGTYRLFFGFQVDDRFYSLTLGFDSSVLPAKTIQFDTVGGINTALDIGISKGDGTSTNSNFMVIIY